MKKLLVLIVIVAAVGTAMALSFHFILTDGKVRLLRKADLTLTDTFVDARGVKRVKMVAKPNLVRAGIKDLLGN